MINISVKVRSQSIDQIKRVSFGSCKKDNVIKNGILFVTNKRLSKWLRNWCGERQIMSHVLSHPLHSFLNKGVLSVFYDFQKAIFGYRRKRAATPLCGLLKTDRINTLTYALQHTLIYRVLFCTHLSEKGRERLGGTLAKTTKDILLLFLCV